MFKISSVIDHLEFLKMRDTVKAMLLLSLCTITLTMALRRIKFFRSKKCKNSKGEESSKYDSENEGNEGDFPSSCLTIHENHENSPLYVMSCEDEIRENELNEHCILPELKPIYDNVTLNESSESSYVSDIEVPRGISSGDSDNDVHILDESSNSESLLKLLQKKRRTRTQTSESQSSYRESLIGTPIDERGRHIDISSSDSSMALDISGPPVLEVMEITVPYCEDLSDPQLHVAPELLLEEQILRSDSKSDSSKSSETSSSTITRPVLEKYRDSETGEKTDLLAASAKSGSKHSDVHLKKRASAEAQGSTHITQRKSSPESSDTCSLNLIPSPTNKRKFYSTDAAGHVTVYQDLSDDEYLEEDRILGNKGKMAGSSIHIYRKRVSKAKSTRSQSGSIEKESILEKEVEEKMAESKKYRHRVRAKHSQLSNRLPTSLAPIGIPLPSFTTLNQPTLVEEMQSTTAATQDVLDESIQNFNAEKLKQDLSPDTSSKNGSSSESGVIYLETSAANVSKKTKSFENISNIQKNEHEISTSEEATTETSEESRSAPSILGLKEKIELWESSFVESKIEYSNPPEDYSEFQDGDSLMVSQQVVEPIEAGLNSSSSSNTEVTEASIKCPLPSFTFFKRPTFNEKTIEAPDKSTIKSNPDNSPESLNRTKPKDVFPDTSKNGSSSDSAVVYLETVPLTKLKDTNPVSDLKKCTDGTSATEESKTNEELKKRSHSPEDDRFKKQKTTEIESAHTQSEVGLSNTPTVELEESSPEVTEIQEIAVLVAPRLVELIDDNIDNSDSSHTEAVIQFLTKDMDKPST